MNFEKKKALEIEMFGNFCQHMYGEYVKEKHAFKEDDIKDKQDYVDDNLDFIVKEYKKWKK